MKWFNKQSRLIQILLLLIPVVNWITEVIVRVTGIIEKPTLHNILGVICAIFIPVFGWFDLVWVLLFNHLCLCK